MSGGVRDSLREELIAALGRCRVEDGSPAPLFREGDLLHIASMVLPVVERVVAEARAEAESVHRDLTRHLGFGDNITEPMADNDTIVRWFDERSSEANEWVESQLWRNDCYAAGHPDDEDCPEHDPILRAEARGRAAVVAKVEAVLNKWEAIDNDGYGYAAGDGPDPQARIDQLRAALGRQAGGGE